MKEKLELMLEKVATSVTLCFTILAVVHGVGNEMEAVEAAGMDNLSNFLLFTWVTITSFEVGIVLGKIAVSAFLLEIIGFTSGYLEKSKAKACR